MDALHETRAAQIIQRNFRKYLSRVRENQKLISKVNTDTREIELNENYQNANEDPLYTLRSEPESITCNNEKERGEKLLEETKEVYEKLQQFYENVLSSGKREISVLDLLGNIERKITELKGVSSLEKCENISSATNENTFLEVAKTRHETYLSNLNKRWWEKLLEEENST